MVFSGVSLEFDFNFMNHGLSTKTGQRSKPRSRDTATVEHNQMWPELRDMNVENKPSFFSHSLFLYGVYLNHSFP